MSRQKTREEILKHQEYAISKITNYLTDCTNSDDNKLRKKSDTLSYWIETYVDYLIQEPNFQPTKLMNYSRGDVIRINLGFRVGAEMGGLHYAVVVENLNVHSANVLTVIPLSSTDGKNVHPSNVDLGAELYLKVSSQQAALRKDLSSELESITDMLAVFDLITAKKKEDINSEEISTVRSTLESLNIKKAHLKKLLSAIDKYSSEISRMKSGSMAVMNQITTISKQRIYTPRKSSDFLYGISLSDSAMEKINKKLVEKLIR